MKVEQNKINARGRMMTAAFVYDAIRTPFSQALAVGWPRSGPMILLPS